jgi:hypothetical protein
MNKLRMHALGDWVTNCNDQTLLCPDCPLGLSNLSLDLLAVVGEEVKEVALDRHFEPFFGGGEVILV